MTADLYPMTLSITLTLDELMKLPGDAVIRLLDKVATPEILRAAYEHETRPGTGKGRWPVMNHIRSKSI